MDSPRVYTGMALAAYVGVVFMVDSMGRINFEEVSCFVSVPTPPLNAEDAYGISRFEQLEATP